MGRSYSAVAMADRCRATRAPRPAASQRRPAELSWHGATLPRPRAAGGFPRARGSPPQCPPPLKRKLTEQADRSTCLCWSTVADRQFGPVDGWRRLAGLGRGDVRLSWMPHLQGEASASLVPKELQVLKADWSAQPPRRPGAGSTAGARRALQAGRQDMPGRIPGIRAVVTPVRNIPARAVAVADDPAGHRNGEEDQCGDHGHAGPGENSGRQHPGGRSARLPSPRQLRQGH